MTVCTSPYFHKKEGVFLDCGQCLNCRIKRKSIWANRLVLESEMYKHSCFVTLTYSNENLPICNNLSPRDLQLFIKRLRYYLSTIGIKIRFYAVGEYGTRFTKRPHYHLAIFGIDGSFREYIDKAWQKGLIDVGTLTKDSANYIAGYVTKKFVNQNDKDLVDRLPEFSRQSQGIGLSWIKEFAKTLKNVKLKEVPKFVQYGKRKLVFGRYLTNKLRDLLGFVSEGFNSDFFKEQKAQVLALFNVVKNNSPQETFVNLRYVMYEYLELYRGKRESFEARYRLYNKVKSKI